MKVMYNILKTRSNLLLLPEEAKSVKFLALLPPTTRTHHRRHAWTLPGEGRVQSELVETIAYTLSTVPKKQLSWLTFNLFKQLINKFLWNKHAPHRLKNVHNIKKVIIYMEHKDEWSGPNIFTCLNQQTFVFKTEEKRKKKNERVD